MLTEIARAQVEVNVQGRSSWSDNDESGHRLRLSPPPSRPERQVPL